jgi:ABC-type phosphate transport system permease subunit
MTAARLLLVVFLALLAAVVVPGLMGLSALSFGRLTWDAPASLSPWPPLLGSLATTGGALALAAAGVVRLAAALARDRGGVPAALEAAGFLPSVVFGFLGLRYLLPPLLALGGGFGLLPAILLLAVMVAPPLLVAVLPAFLEAEGYLAEEVEALGLPSWLRHALVRRRARRGVARGLAYGAVRVLGESVAAAMMLGMGVGLPAPFRPSSTLAALLVVEGPGAAPGSRWEAALAALALLLVSLAGLVTWLLEGGSA